MKSVLENKAKEENIMKYIVVDLEMNPIDSAYKDERATCKLEVIEIGAVLLDEYYHEIGRFVTLVKPQYNTRIEKKYEKLTEIKTEMVASAPYFADALQMFFQWCSSIPGENQIVQWSENDYLQISREIVLKNVSLSDENRHYMENSWLDFQKEYGDTLGFDRNLSLKDAIMYAGRDFSGHQHDALDDAKNTADLFAIIRDKEMCQKTLCHVIDVLKPKKDLSLGDIFDFSGISFTA